MEKFFQIKERNSSIRTEIIGGITTFMTMSYIVALNPNILTNFGAGGQDLWNAVFLATCISTAFGTILMGVIANLPFALAPTMGLNSFFATVVGSIAAMTGMGYVESFQSALVIIFIEGIVFTILSVLSIREKIISAIPAAIRLGVAPAVGMMLINIGFGSNAGVYSEKGTFYVLRDFFGSLTAGYAKETMGEVFPEMILSACVILIGIILIFGFKQWGKKGYVLYGMLAASVIYWVGEAVFLHANPFEGAKTFSITQPFQDLFHLTFFKFNFEGFLSIGVTTAITLIVTFCFIDMFDTIGTFIGTAAKGGFLRKDGSLEGMKEGLLSDAISTTLGACLGTSTVSTFVESAAGVEAGARTGLSSVVSGILFGLCIFLGPLVGFIPAPATSAALIYVGVSMLSALQYIDIRDEYQLLPVAIMLITMPISGSVGHGIALGMITFTAMKLISGKWKEVSVLTYILSVLFVIKFFVAG